MEVLSRGWRTDLAILALSGSEIEQHPTYVVVRTPGNPGYRWGNFVLLRRAPLRGDLGLVEDLFVRELPGHRAPRVRRRRTGRRIGRAGRVR